ncbi:putative zn(2)-C6 fungal-type DNA-binding domain, trimeric LpxA-like superfamily [Septoria linicola]|nr:putative zn(2)-C6 fungal-type DNA-binding domain, trimeric LpxA-like superfamily [Septoria linicola]
MRDDIGILNRTPIPESRTNGTSTAVKESAPAGFTAVNTGDIHGAANFRHDGLGPRPITLPPVDHRSEANGEATTMSGAAYHAHSWRPTEPSDKAQQNHVKENPTNKRKRADSPADDHSTDGHVQQRDGEASGSPKRRTLDGPDEHDGPYSQREGHDELEEPNDDPYKRALSPTEKGLSKPPPAPRPEVEAALRAQVQQFTAQPQAHPRSGSSPSPEEDQAQQGPFPYASEHSLGADDKSKRKRNFSNRTKTGCHTCRTRKKKCDEGKPHCQNCIRGSFRCGGYGPKPPGGLKPITERAAMPLQAKQNEAYTPVNGQPYGFERGSYPESHPQPGQTPIERYALPPPRLHDPQPPRHAGPQFPADNRLPPGPESWHRRPHPPYDERRELPPAQYHPPDVALPPYPPHVYPPSLPPPPPPPPPPRGYYPAPHGELFHAPPPHMYRPGTATAHTAISSRESVVSSGSGSHQSGLPAYLQNPGTPVTARSKMLRGERYLHFQDTALRNERTSCRKAVEAYNDSCKAVNPSSSHEQERNFLAIYEPKERAWELGKAWDGPKGSVGSHSVVETPFNCEFGYNIHLGKDVLIQQNCTLQDASIIYIGDRSIVGPNVKFYCITTSVDAQQRRGSRGEFQAGPIRVEEDVVIHADCIILPFRTIGKGAVVGAGSVVTRDVKPYTVVAGNPARPIRKRKIESGPNVDKHSDEIEEQNQEMLRKLQNNEVIPRDD